MTYCSFNMLSTKWLLGLACVFSTLIYIGLNKSRREALIARVRFRARRASTAKTPPRSLSPETKSPSNQALPQSYCNALPPIRREAAGLPEVSEAEIRANILPMEADYSTCDDGSMYTPTGFSVDEIKKFGDFPDYPRLSGVPLPKPYHEFELDKALPRPYRPFRWAYHQTMSLKKLETDWWIELENTYKERISHRKELYAKYGKEVLAWLPGSELACKELMEMVLQFVCARYPKHFSLHDNRILKNNILQTEQDVRSKHPLEILMDNIPEDFAIMLRDDKTGFYFFRAGVICSSLGWNVGSKIGLQLHQIHEPIPDYKEKMQFSMDRFFSKMPADRPIQRGSWGLEVGTPLYMPPGDPHELHRLSQDPDLCITDCYLRVDWQTLRRLPLSGAIVFNFKAVFTQITEFRDEPGVPALVVKILKEGKENMMKYKNTWHTEHVIVPKLDEWAKEQEDTGLMEKNWKVATLDEDPMFRGWEEKWHRQQGY